MILLSSCPILGLLVATLIKILGGNGANGSNEYSVVHIPNSCLVHSGATCFAYGDRPCIAESIFYLENTGLTSHHPPASPMVQSILRLVIRIPRKEKSWFPPPPPHLITEILNDKSAPKKSYLGGIFSWFAYSQNCIFKKKADCPPPPPPSLNPSRSWMDQPLSIFSVFSQYFLCWLLTTQIT